MLNIFNRKNLKPKADEQGLRIDFFQEEQWQDLLDQSMNESIFLFKHSIRCGVSSMVLSRFEKQMRERNKNYYFLNILGNRDLSNWIADELNIRHESPQLIVLKNAKVIAYDSHYNLLDISKEIPV
jgi:bacillithiol system protein YtxJ